jgi:hypothetical protein
MKTGHFRPQFVESVPETLDVGVLYVSMSLASVIHLCACGCGQEVITPLSPTDWKLWFDGENVTLDPSIGNWSFRCRSHYWIRGGAVQWSGSWSDGQIASGRAHDRERKSAYYEEPIEAVQELKPVATRPAPNAREGNQHPSWIAKAWKRLTASRHTQ